MITSVRCLVVAAMLLGGSGAAIAQTGNRVAVGGSVTANILPASGTGGSATLGFELRLGHEEPGWGVQTSIFGWLDTGIHESIAGITSDWGSLRLRPIMAGYGYTWVRGRTSLTADVVGGYSLNSFHLDSAAVRQYAQRLAATDIDSEATNAFAVKPEVQVWYDLNDRFALKLTGGYLIERPSVVITSSIGRDERSIRADAFVVTIGVVYSLF